MSIRGFFKRLGRQSVTRVESDAGILPAQDKSTCINAVPSDSVCTKADDLTGTDSGILSKEPEETCFEDTSALSLSIITTERLRQLADDPGIPREIRDFISTFISKFGSYYIREKSVLAHPKEVEACDYGTSRITTSEEAPLSFGKLIGPRFQPKVNKWLENNESWPFQLLTPEPVNERKHAVKELPQKLPAKQLLHSPEVIPIEAPAQLTTQLSTDLPAQLPVQSPVHCPQPPMPPSMHLLPMKLLDSCSSYRTVEFSPKSPMKPVHSLHAAAELPVRLPPIPPPVSTLTQTLPSAPNPQPILLGRMPSDISDAPSLVSLKSSCSTLSSKPNPCNQLDLTMLSDFTPQLSTNFKIGTVPRHSSKLTWRKTHSSNAGLPCFELNNPNTYCGSAAMSGPYPCIPNRKSIASDGNFKRMSNIIPIASVYE